MRLRDIFRVFAWVVATGFLADVLRRCWIVQAWTIGPFAAVALAYSIARVRANWKRARRSSRVDFIRPGLPRFDDVH